MMLSRCRAIQLGVGTVEKEAVKTGPVLSRSCCVGLVYKSSSGVGEAMLPSVVLGFGATVPWVHQASPAGPHHPFPFTLIS